MLSLQIKMPLILSNYFKDYFLSLYLFINFTSNKGSKAIFIHVFILSF